MRAPVQAGFRPALGTSHPLFGLRHLVERAKARCDPLYVCFVDLVKAYDTMPRHLLWHIMACIGVPQQFVQAIKSMYAGLVCQVKVEGCLSSEFESTMGVKQGCPLSPTLFGIFIDRLYFRVMSRVPHCGPGLSSGIRVPMMLYADDFCLVARAGSDMRCLLGEVDHFNEASGMHASMGPGKTEMMLTCALPFPRC